MGERDGRCAGGQNRKALEFDLLKLHSNFRSKIMFVLIFVLIHENITGVFKQLLDILNTANKQK